MISGDYGRCAILAGLGGQGCWRRTPHQGDHVGKEGFELTPSLDAPALGTGPGALATTADRDLPDEAQPVRSPYARPLSEGKAAVIDVLLLLLLAASVVAVSANLTSVRPELAVAAATFVPGWAVLSRLPATDLLTSAALAVAVSLTLEIGATLILGWTHWWHPQVLGAGLAGASAFLLVLRIAAVIRRRETRLRPGSPRLVLGSLASSTILQLLPFVAAMVLWGVSLGQIDVASLGINGLATAFPGTWYAALVLLIVGGTWACWGRRTSGWVMAVYPLAVVLVLFATVPAVSDVPRYAWVFKHIGVTDFIQSNGGPSVSGDIYNRFPGFFTLAAAASSWMGIGPLKFAGWGEPFFALLDTLLVAAGALVVKPDRRVAAFAALLFALSNWIGETYFSPQAAAFVLALAVILIALRGLPPGLSHPGLPRTLSRLRAWARDAKASPLWNSKASTAAILVLDAALVLTHQLSPYIVLLQFGLLVVSGVARGAWQLGVMAAMTIGFTAANFSYLNHTYGLLGSLNPFANLGTSPATFGAIAHAGLLEAHGGFLVAGILAILTLSSAWRLTRRGEGAHIVVPLLLVVAPTGVLFGQAYGGEATLRAYLFSLPWQTSLIAAAITTVRPRLARAMGAGVLSLTIAVGFVPAFFGADGLNIFPPGEVAASAYFYSHAPSGSVLVLAAPDFPTSDGARYPVIDAAGTSLVSRPEFEHRDLGPADVPAVGAAILRTGTSDFLVFSVTEARSAQWAELAPPHALQNLEGAVAVSPYFRLWYANRDARIYELVSGQPLDNSTSHGPTPR